MAAQSLSATSIIRPEYKQPTRNSLAPHKTLQSQWPGTISGTNLLLQSSSNLRPFFTRRLRINAKSSLALPTAKPDRVKDAEKIPKWSQKAIKSFAMAEMRAWKMKSPTTGTEALVMGIIDEGTSFASRYLRANGFTLAKVRDEIIKLLGEPDRSKLTPFLPPIAEAAQEVLDWAVDEKLKSGTKPHHAFGHHHMML